MGIFDDKKGKQIEYLEEERKRLWDRVVALEKSYRDLQKDVQRKASDSEKEAAQSSRKAAEFKNKTEQRYEEAEKLANSIKINSENIQKVSDEVSAIKTSLSEKQKEYFEQVESLETTIENLDNFLDKYPELDTQLEEVEESILKIEQNAQKSSVSLNSINSKRNEIDTIYREILGYSETDEEGKVTKIEGRKDELENAYKKISDDLENAQSNIDTIDENYKISYANFEKQHKEKYKAITDEITALLPNALTAGLSAAFSKKKEEEVISSTKLQSTFSTGIYMLIGVSLLPFIISAIFLYQNILLEEVIRRLPRLVLAIVPMYIPVLWFTYSANKKLNLSKRLIEEYAHKEVLSKTYEGLTKQIANISDEEQSSELKFKLLSNFLQVSSENPGKLISNYEASDHPIMEALEQSYKFQLAIDRLEGIPGLGKVAAILESKSKRKLENRKEVIEKALDVEKNEEEI